MVQKGIILGLYSNLSNEDSTTKQETRIKRPCSHAPQPILSAEILSIGNMLHKENPQPTLTFFIQTSKI